MSRTDTFQGSALIAKVARQTKLQHCPDEKGTCAYCWWKYRVAVAWSQCAGWRRADDYLRRYAEQRDL